MFYVYTMTDPRNGAVFYVGKGCRGRIDEHEKEARRGVKSRKCARIRDIEAAGLAVMKAKVARFEDEQEAYDFETAEIARIGLAALTNVMPGGQRAWLDRQAASAEREAKRAAAKHEATKGWLRKWLSIVDGWKHGVTFPNLPDGDRKASEFVAAVRGLVA